MNYVATELIVKKMAFILILFFYLFETVMLIIILWWASKHFRVPGQESLVCRSVGK